MQTEDIAVGEIWCTEIKQIPDSYPHPCFIPSHTFHLWYEVRTIDYCIGGKSEKWNNLFLTWFFFPFLMAILPVKSPYTLTIIARGAPLVLPVVAGHVGCYQIFGIWYNRLLSHPLWKLICGILGWFTTWAISLWPAVFLYMALFTTIVTSYIWPGRWTFYRATTISTVAALEINLLQSLVDWLFNGHSVCLWKWRLVWRLFFACNRFPLLWIHKIAVFLRSLLYKGLIGYEILLW